MITRTLTLISALALTFALLFAQDKGGQDKEKKGPQWKDQAEYDLFDSAAKEANPQTRLQTLQKWTQQYPTTDFAEQRRNAFFITYQQIAPCGRQTWNFSLDMLKDTPNDSRALTVIVSCVQQQAFNAQPPDLDTAERVARHFVADYDAIYADSNKPQGTTDQQWAEAKAGMKAYARQTVNWIAVTRKDHPKAEQQLTASLKEEPANGQASYWLASELLVQNKEHPEKQVPALFSFARASAYDGPGSLPAAQRKQVNDYLTKIYAQYHGSNEGLDKLLALAKTNALPPADFTIKDIGTIRKEQADALNAERAKNPMMTLWTDLKEKLTAADGAQYFEGTLKDSEPPPFKAILISMTPANRPKELTLGLEKPDVADVKLKFEEALPGKMEPGAELTFQGTVVGYNKEPYSITFEVDPMKLQGWTGKNAPGAKKAAPATKGAAPAPAAPKGKAK